MSVEAPPSIQHNLTAASPWHSSFIQQAQLAALLGLQHLAEYTPEQTYRWCLFSNHNNLRKQFTHIVGGQRTHLRAASKTSTNRIRRDLLLDASAHTQRWISLKICIFCCESAYRYSASHSTVQYGCWRTGETHTFSRETLPTHACIRQCESSKNDIQHLFFRQQRSGVKASVLHCWVGAIVFCS